MAYFYTFDRTKNIAFITATGKIISDEMIKKTMELFRNVDWEKDLNLLIDYREVDDISLKYKDIKRFLTNINKLVSKLKAARIAVVSENSCTFCLTRLWENLGENKATITSKIFQDYGKAEQWLGLAPE